MTESEERQANEGCGGCSAPVPVDESNSAWRVWAVETEFSQKPGGREDIEPVITPVGTIFVLCGQCTGLLASGQYRELAARIAGTCDWPAPEQAVAEMVGWLMRLHSQALPLTVAEWTATE